MKSEFGLLTKDEESTGESIPLLGVKVDGNILGRGAMVRVLQRFRNHESKAVEAIYKFPLPEGAAICGFKAHVDDRVIEGKVEEKEKAFEIYDDALAKGDGGYLLDEERPNIFTLSVGNLNPGAEALIEIEYATLLDMEGKKIRFFLPTTISPRYIPDEVDDDNGIPVDGKLNSPYAPDVPYGLSIALRIHKGSLLESVESPSHQVRIENLKGDPINVTLSAESVRMDRDFILYMDYANSLVNRAYQYRTDKEAFIQLDFLPEEDLMGEKPKDKSDSADLKREIIFLVDCSGSMEGDSIQEAKKALEVCLRGLEQGRSFNIYRFGSTHESLFPEASSYNEKTAHEALAYLKTMDADLGGTEILKPLNEICSSKHKAPNSVMDIILLTDGEVGNESEIFDLIKKNNEKIRVFPVGIGAGCNEYFIKGLARAGRGFSEFIFPGERIEPKVLGLFGKVAQEVVTDLAISWGTSSVEQAPAMPVTFMSSPVTVFARVTGASIGRTKLNVKGKVNGREKTWEIEVVDLNELNLPIPVLWAREKIRDLEESGDALVRGSRQRERKHGQVKDNVVEISKKYGILSQSTSYVAVEEREEKDRTTGELVLRKIPVLVTVGWHGIGGIRPSYPIPSPPLVASVSFDRSQEPPDPFQLLCPVREMECDEFHLSYVDDTPPSQLRMPHKLEGDQDPRMDVLLSILSLQKATGGMELDPRISSSLGIDFGDLKELSKQVEVGVPVDKFLLLSTAILLRVLELRFPDRGNMWARVVKKSRDWFMEIDANGNPRIQGKHLMDWAEEFVRDNLAMQI